MSTTTVRYIVQPSGDPVMRSIVEVHPPESHEPDRAVFDIYATEAHEIARKLNSHAALLEACKEAVAAIESASFDRYAGAALQTAYDNMRTAIDAAEGR